MFGDSAGTSGEATTAAAADQLSPFSAGGGGGGDSAGTGIVWAIRSSPLSAGGGDDVVVFASSVSLFLFPQKDCRKARNRRFSPLVRYIVLK